MSMRERANSGSACLAQFAGENHLTELVQRPDGVAEEIDDERVSVVRQHQENVSDGVVGEHRRQRGDEPRRNASLIHGRLELVRQLVFEVR